MPTFNGIEMFGTACTVLTTPESHAVQLNAYCGVNGVEALGMGERGLVSIVTGELPGYTPVQIGILYVALLRLVAQGPINGLGVFYDDTKALTYPGSYIETVRQTSVNDPTSGGGFTQGIEARVRHLYFPF